MRHRTRALRLAALALALCLLLSGCSISYDPVSDGLRIFSDLFSGGGGDDDFPAAEFRAPDRADADYADLRYEHYDIAQYRRLTDAVSAAAAAGSQANFDAAAAAAEEGMRYIAGLSARIDLQAAADPADPAVAEESLYTTGVYYDAWTHYWTAMHEVAVSERADLLGGYSDQQIAWFENYAPEEAEATRILHDRESALIKQYEALISAEEVDYDAVCALYVELVSVRRTIAADEGYDSYAEYAYDALYARNYGPDDARRLWSAAKNHFIPLLADVSEGIWDRADAAAALPGLSCAPEDVLAALETVSAALAPELGEACRYMTDHGLYDIAPDPRKLSTGYTTYLYDVNQPFIFNAASGSYYDYTDMFHELGHFINYYYCGSDLLFGIADNDLSELHSQGLEVLALPYYGQIFGPERGDALADETVLNLLYSVADGALYDEFQQKVYAEEDLTPARVQDLFLEVCADYGYAPDEEGAREWMDQVHNFEYPFYYISYAVSAVPALELYTFQREDPARAVARYLYAVSLSCEDWYFTDAVDSAGFSDPFSGAALRRIAAAVREGLEG